MSSERRLHPSSPLFELIERIKAFLLPLVVLLVTGRGDRNEFIMGGIVALLALGSVVRYFTFHFEITADGVVIRNGLLFKSVRTIPFDRVQNVSLRQSMVHRMFGVADVELESAGGAKAEGRMRVLSLDDAHALEATVRERGRAVAAAANPAAPVGVPAPARALLSLDSGELVRLGLISNRGMLLAAAGFGVLMQFGSDRISEDITEWITSVSGSVESLHLGTTTTVILAIGLAVGALAVLTVLSILFAVLRYFDFKLSDDGRRLRVERGLFTRVRGALQRKRIQAYTVRESILHRLFKRRSLLVDSIGGTADQDRSLRELAPVAKPAQVDTLVSHLLGTRASWPPSTWRSLHPRAWRRVFTRSLILTLVATTVAVLAFDRWGWIVLAGIPLAYVRARVWARYAGYAEEQGLVAVREGWLSRTWRFAEVRKLQVLAVTQSPFDRRHDMATLWLDTAGAANARLPLRIRYLPVQDAVAIRARLAGAMSR